MPTASNLKSSFSRAQLALLPPTPADAINIVIPEVCANIKTDINAPPVRFLMFNTSFATVVGGPLAETILDFGTDEMFQNMCDAKTVYMDGTFSICPKQFYQFFTLHFFAVDSRRLLPAVYFLLTSKTESLYTKLFNMVKAKAAEMGIQIRWDSSMSDFESGLLPSLLNAFPPPFKRHGCSFHNCDAVLKWIRGHFLVSSSYNKNKNIL